MTGSFDASELLQQLEKFNQPFQSSHWVVSSPAAMIGLAFIISLLSFAIWKNCCTKPDIQPALPALSAPPAVNPGVPLQPVVMAPQQVMAKRKRTQQKKRLSFFYFSFSHLFSYCIFMYFTMCYSNPTCTFTGSYSIQALIALIFNKPYA